MLLIHVPERVTWRVGDYDAAKEDLSIRGQGRYISFGIADMKLLNGRPQYLFRATRFGGCMKQGCRRTPDGGDWVSGGTVLKPGNYRVYVVTDGAPVKIVWRLQALSGASRLSLSEHLRTKIFSPKPRFSLGERSYFTSGVTVDLDGPAYYDSMLWARTPALGAQFSWCGYGGRQPDNADEAFSPPYCALNDDQGSIPFATPPRNADSVRYFDHTSDQGVERGVRSVGHWFKSNVPVERAGSTHVYLIYPKN